MTIGENLKRARNEMKLELGEVAQKTKIAKMYLIALENDDLSSMPGGVYTRNFLRTYAKFLNLDEDILTAEFDEQYAVKPHFVLQQEQAKLDDLQFQKNRRQLGVISLVLLVIIAVVGLYFGGGNLDFGASLTTPAVTPGQSQPEPEPRAEVPDPVPLAATPAVETAGPAQAGDPVVDESDQAPDADQPISDGDDNQPTAVDESADDAAQVAAPQASAAEDTADASPPMEEPVAESETISQQSEGESVAAAALAETLPLDTLDGVDVLPAGSGAETLEDVWIVEALGRVWVEITIDGQIVTQRNLRKGMVRVYKYGKSNTLVVGDAGLVAIQDGSRFRERVGKSKSVVAVRYVGPGAILSAIEEKVGPLADLGE